MRYIHLTWIIFLGGLELTAQKIDIKDFVVAKDGLVTCQLYIHRDHSETERYSISVFTSDDEYTKPLEFTLEDIMTDKWLDIRFDAADRIKNSTEGIVFKFKAAATVFPIKITDKTRNKFYINRKVKIYWEDYFGKGPYSLGFIRNDNVDYLIASDVTQKSFEWKVPKYLPVGKHELQIYPQITELGFDSEYKTIYIRKPKALKWTGIGVAAAAIGYVILKFFIFPNNDNSPIKESTLPSPPLVPDAKN